MTRPRKIRRIIFNPRVTYYKPRGIPLISLEEIVLLAEELEAIRLKNHEGLDQIDCAQKMKVSQSTFQRILASAHQKIADALIFGKAIRIEGKDIKMITPRLRHRRRRR